MSKRIQNRSKDHPILVQNIQGFGNDYYLTKNSDFQNLM